MSLKPTATTYCILIIGYNLLLATVAWTTQRFVAESSPVARGAEYIRRSSCINCHGQPQHQASDHTDDACSSSSNASWHLAYTVDCDDAMAYFGTVRLRRNFAEREKSNPDHPVIVGERLARQYHCFNCHGQLGQGGLKNTGSFKGYIPGFFGRDFAILTKNGDTESLREWITHGRNSGLVARPVTGRIAKYYFDRQEISMPQFQTLQSEEIDLLVHYVSYLHSYGPMNAAKLRAYDKRSRSTE